MRYKTDKKFITNSGKALKFNFKNLYIEIALIPLSVNKLFFSLATFFPNYRQNLGWRHEASIKQQKLKNITWNFILI